MTFRAVNKALQICLSIIALMIGSASPAAANTGDPTSTAETGEPVQRSYFATIVDIPMRDGTILRANLFTPGHGQPAPVVVAATPYGRHMFYPIGQRFVARGLAFLMVDVRGRGDSEGEFAMFYGDKLDMVDIIDWAGRQPFSDGKVVTWGASYGGYNQWMAAAKNAPGLRSIVPAAAVYPGYDFPMVLNVGYPYASIWTGFTKGRNANFALFNDQTYWREAFTDLLASGVPFKDTDRFVGFDNDLFDEWVAHPSEDAYWRSINPSDEEMARIDLPILSITGLYDGAQIGALRYYEQHVANASEEAGGKHYLVIGPYDHGAVHAPKDTIGGLSVPDRGGIDTLELIGEWYAWHLMGAPRPAFLTDRVMYYVMGEGADEWRGAASLGAIPVVEKPYLLSAPGGDPTSLRSVGTLSERAGPPRSVHYRFDPADIGKAPLGIWHTGDWVTYSADVEAIDGEAFVFETSAFDEPVELVGRPRFYARIGITTPDADFQARIYEVRADGASIYLGETRARARYRESRSEEKFIKSPEPLEYRFEDFNFIARRIQAGSRIRFVFGAPNSIYIQRNYNAAKKVAEQVPADAMTADVSMMLGGIDGARLVLPLRNPASR